MDEKEVREAIEVIKSNYPTSGYYMLCEALDTALEALEKQLPMKPLEVKNSPIPSEKLYYCPICNGRFVNSGTIGYCYHCGQRLDWSE